MEFEPTLKKIMQNAYREINNDIKEMGKNLDGLYMYSEAKEELEITIANNIHEDDVHAAMGGIDPTAEIIQRVFRSLALASLRRIKREDEDELKQ